MCPSKVADGAQRGWIVPIGGAEDKEGDKRVLQRFLALCGGNDAAIVVIPTASRLNDTGERYGQLFGAMGARKVDVLDFDTRRDAQERSRVALIEQATGIFITGGNQLRLSTILGGTPVAQAIRACNAQGVTVGGTSAGAGILSEHMIASGPGAEMRRSLGTAVFSGMLGVTIVGLFLTPVFYVVLRRLFPVRVRPGAPIVENQPG